MRLYKKGVREFLDRYYSSVSSRFGHFRKGDRQLAPRIAKRGDYIRFKEAAEQQRADIEADVSRERVQFESLRAKA